MAHRLRSSAPSSGKLTVPSARRFFRLTAISYRFTGLRLYFACRRI